MDKYRIRNIQSNAKGVTEQAIEMLLAWQEEHGRRATIQALCIALVRAKFREAAEKVFGEIVVAEAEAADQPTEEAVVRRDRQTSNHQTSDPVEKRRTSTILQPQEPGNAPNKTACAFVLIALAVLGLALWIGPFRSPSSPPKQDDEQKTKPVTTHQYESYDWEKIGEHKVTDEHIKAICEAAQSKWKKYAIALNFGTDRFSDYERKGDNDFVSLHSLLSDWRADNYSPKLFLLLNACKEARIDGKCKEKIEKTL
eukprot:m.311582 g.311582  ORF g.311582 m.311582 type:complete len:255 (+) comp83252_c0_seq1:174-938(+)